MKKNSFSAISIFFTAILLFLEAAVPTAALADTRSASAARLLRYEGVVEIEDKTGQARPVTEYAVLSSGDALCVGEDGLASVNLDSTKVVLLDSGSRVVFTREQGAARLDLTEGNLLLDVQESLGENETLDIAASGMTVGIRGTIVYVSDRPQDETTGADGARLTTLGVLEGTASVRYTDSKGTSRLLSVPAGQKAVAAGGKDASSAFSEMTVTKLENGDLPGFIQEQISKDPALQKRTEPGIETLPTQVEDFSADSFPADGDWYYSGEVTIVAQSAGKLYDGTPLTRPDGALVYGLPADFTISVSVTGSQTNAGESVNTISSYSIYNKAGENVNSHFPAVRTVDGSLVVDRVPITVWTGSAEKEYDGTPLTNSEAGLRTLQVYEEGQPSWRNSSWTATEADGAAGDSEALYGLTGVTQVHVTNPLTGGNKEFALNAGQRLSVRLSNEAAPDGGGSIEFSVTDLREDQLPDEVLRLYADNPELLAQACADTGWDRDLILQLISALPPTVSQTAAARNGVEMAASEEDRLITGLADVQVHIDTSFTDYGSRTLSSDEAHFTGFAARPGIRVIATGSQTQVGQSTNTYTLDWGSESPGNYVLREDLGTLTVTSAAPAPLPNQTDPVTFTAGSAEKVYDGTPLTTGAVTASGLPAGYSFTASVSGSQTDAGSSASTVTSCRIFDAQGNDVTSKFTNIRTVNGSLTVTPLQLEADLGGYETIYSGEPVFPDDMTVVFLNGPHAGEQMPPTREESKKASTYAASFLLFTGDTLKLSIETGTDAGAYSYIPTVSVTPGDKKNFEISWINEKFEITPAEITVTTGSARKTFDGSALTCPEAVIEGLAERDEGIVVVTATGSVTDADTADNTFSIDWGTAKETNYELTENPGTLEVTPLPVEFMIYCYEGTYDGYVFVPETIEMVVDGGGSGGDVNYEYGGDGGGESVAVTGVFDLPGGGTVELRCPGVKDAGTYTITPAVTFLAGNPANYTLSYSGNTMIIDPAPATVITGSLSKQYDGEPLTCPEASIEGLAGGETATVTATGSITEEGTAANTYTIEWGTAKASNYTLSEQLGTLEVTAKQEPEGEPGPQEESDPEPGMEAPAGSAPVSETPAESASVSETPAESASVSETPAGARQEETETAATATKEEAPPAQEAAGTDAAVTEEAAPTAQEAAGADAEATEEKAPAAQEAAETDAAVMEEAAPATQEAAGTDAAVMEEAAPTAQEAAETDAAVTKEAAPVDTVTG